MQSTFYFKIVGQAPANTFQKNSAYFLSLLISMLSGHDLAPQLSLPNHSLQAVEQEGNMIFTYTQLEKIFRVGRLSLSSTELDDRAAWLRGMIQGSRMEMKNWMDFAVFNNANPTWSMKLSFNATQALWSGWFASRVTPERITKTM